MAAYIVFIRESTRDAAELETYSQEVGATLAGHPVTVLAAYGRHEVLEGPDVEGVVIVEFPSLDEAKAWLTAPPIAKSASIVFEAPISPSSSRASESVAAGKATPTDTPIFVGVKRGPGRGFPVGKNLPGVAGGQEKSGLRPPVTAISSSGPAQVQWPSCRQSTVTRNPRRSAPSAMPWPLAIEPRTPGGSLKSPAIVAAAHNR